MEISQQFEGEILDVRIDGELDAHSSIELDEVIKSAIEVSATKITVDCRDMTYISSAGLGVFISHHDDLKSQGGKFVFYGMSSSVFQVFKILGLHAIMEVTNDKEAAQDLMNEG